MRTEKHSASRKEVLVLVCERVGVPRSRGQSLSEGTRAEYVGVRLESSGG